MDTAKRTIAPASPPATPQVAPAFASNDPRQPLLSVMLVGGGETRPLEEALWQAAERAGQRLVLLHYTGTFYASDGTVLSPSKVIAIATVRLPNPTFLVQVDAQGGLHLAQDDDWPPLRLDDLLTVIRG